MSLSHLSQAPRITPVSSITVPEILEFKGANQIPIFEIRKAGSGVIKAEIVFICGRPAEKKKLAASVCTALLRESSGPWSTRQMADYVGFYGASLEVHVTLDTVTIELVCLSKHLKKFIRPLKYLLSDPKFKQRELKAFVNRRCQKLKVELNKNEVVSYRQLTEAIFGAEHPYGYNSTAELYQQIARPDVVQYFEENIHSARCIMFAAGDITEIEHQIILELCSLIRTGGDLMHQGIKPLEQLDHKFLRYPGNPAQSSIKIGRLAMTRNHPDFIPMTILNTLIGGFFGSRLLSILREKNGLTYGVYSTLDAYLHEGIMMISTEVAQDNVKTCLELIYQELARLQEEPVLPDEMQLVRNYIMGVILHLFDGPFNSIRAIKSLALSRIPTSEINSLIQISQTITPQDLNLLAQKYLNRNDFWEVVVG